MSQISAAELGVYRYVCEGDWERMARIAAGASLLVRDYLQQEGYAYTVTPMPFLGLCSLAGTEMRRRIPDQGFDLAAFQKGVQTRSSVHPALSMDIQRSVVPERGAKRIVQLRFSPSNPVQAAMFFDTRTLNTLAAACGAPGLRFGALPLVTILRLTDLTAHTGPRPRQFTYPQAREVCEIVNRQVAEAELTAVTFGPLVVGRAAAGDSNG